MLTPRDIEEAGFTKAIFGGYDMESVDDFLEIVADDYNKLYKDNAVLKSKMKVLVTKIEEYRKTEESMRTVLSNARKTSEDIVSQAKSQSSTILSDAESAAEARLRDIEKRIEEEKERLRSAQQETYEFIKASQKLIDVYKGFLAKIESIELETEPKQESKPEPVHEPTPKPAQEPISPANEPEPEPVKTHVKLKIGEKPAPPINEPDSVPKAPESKPEPAKEKPALDDTMIFRAVEPASKAEAEENLNSFVSSILAQDDDDDAQDIEDIRQEYSTRRVRHSSKRPTTDQVTLFASDKKNAEIDAIEENELVKVLETLDEPADADEVIDDIAESIEESVLAEEPVQVEEKDEAALYEETKRLFYEDDEDTRSPRPKFDFDNLQFGSNYDSSN